MSTTSLASRLANLQQAVVAVVMLAFAASALWVTERTLVGEERAMLAETAHRVADNLDREYTEEGTLARAASEMMKEESTAGIRVEVFDNSGELLASSSTGSATADEADFEDGEQSRADANCGATVVASGSSAARKTSLAALRRGFLIAAGPVLLLMYVASRALSRRALLPLSEMGQRAREASGEESVRTIGPESGFAEIDALRASFDRLLRRLDDLLQAERRFAADASHELRTPLTVLSGEIEMALAIDELPPDCRSGLERAAGQARVVRDLVDALLLLRRTGSETDSARAGFEPVNLADIARDIVRETSARFAARSEDVQITAPDEALIRGSPALLASALRNVVDNALKFTTRGQPVRITVDAAASSVSVDDGGPGIPAVERDRVFDPFYRGSEARAESSGLGLGLPILRQVVQAHGGDVTIGVSPFGGARVVLRFPVLA